MFYTILLKVPQLPSVPCQLCVFYTRHYLSMSRVQRICKHRMQTDESLRCSESGWWRRRWRLSHRDSCRRQRKWNSEDDTAFQLLAASASVSHYHWRCHQCHQHCHCRHHTSASYIVAVAVHRRCTLSSYIVIIAIHHHCTQSSYIVIVTIHRHHRHTSSLYTVIIHHHRRCTS